MSKQDVIAALRLQIEEVTDRECTYEDNLTCSDGAAGSFRYAGSSDCGGGIASGESSGRARMESEEAPSAFKKIIALVNASDKSELSIRSRLQHSGFSQQAIDESVSEAKRYGFIDDKRYAEVLVRSRISQSKGSAGIVRELAENGIDAQEIAGWPHDFPVAHEQEVQRALSLLERKPPRTKNEREGAYRRLMQKGYPSAVCATASRMWCEMRQSQ